MYSFEGDFRRKPIQSLRGASKKVIYRRNEGFYIEKRIFSSSRVRQWPVTTYMYEHPTWLIDMC